MAGGRTGEPLYAGEQHPAMAFAEIEVSIRMMIRHPANDGQSGIHHQLARARPEGRGHPHKQLLANLSFRAILIN